MVSSTPAGSGLPIGLMPGALPSDQASRQTLKTTAMRFFLGHNHFGLFIGTTRLPALAVWREAIPMRTTRQPNSAITIPTTAAAITAVATQPTARSAPPTANSPMIFAFAVIAIMIAITGTATTPLTTALQ